MKRPPLKTVNCCQCGDELETRSTKFKILCKACKGHLPCTYCGKPLGHVDSATKTCRACLDAIAEQKRKDELAHSLNKQCPWCLERFTANVIAQVYCSEAHKRQSEAYKKRRARLYAKAEKTDGASYPVDECQREPSKRHSKCSGKFLATHHSQVMCEYCAKEVG